MNIELQGELPILPPLSEQAKFVAYQRAKEIAAAIGEQCQKPTIELPLLLNGQVFNEVDFPATHLLTKAEGYQPPHPDLVKAYFDQLKSHDKQYTDEGIAKLLGVSDGRSIRRFKSGERYVPYEVWRKFLIATGRAPLDMPVMIGFFK